MEKETIFSTTLKRYKAVDDLIADKHWDKRDHSVKKRIMDLRDRVEIIIGEMFYKRAIGDKVVKYVRENYIDLDKGMNFLTFDKYGYCKELWEQSFILLDEDFFDALFKKTIEKELNNIEKHNLKLW